jgi:hypothetical protein
MNGMVSWDMYSSDGSSDSDGPFTGPFLSETVRQIILKKWVNYVKNLISV